MLTQLMAFSFPGTEHMNKIYKALSAGNKRCDMGHHMHNMGRAVRQSSHKADKGEVDLMKDVGFVKQIVRFVC